MVTIEKDQWFYITVVDKDGMEQELNLNKEQMTALYGEIGKMLSAEYAEDIQEFFKKSKEHKGDEKACDAISTQEVQVPDLDFDNIIIPVAEKSDIKIDKNSGPINIKM